MSLPSDSIHELAKGLIATDSADKPNNDNVTDAETETDATQEQDDSEDTVEETDSDNSEQETDTEETAEQSEEEATDEQAKVEPALVTVVIDGKEEKVTLEEALAGYQRQADATRKTQAAAEERKAAEAEKAALAKTRSEYQQILDLAKANLDKAMPNLTPEQWEKLEAEDPGEYQRLVLLKIRLREQRETIDTEAKRVAEEKAKEDAVLRQKYLQTEAASLLAKQPAWRDPAKYTADMTALRSYVKETWGVQDAEFDAVTDHRVLLAFNKARLYDALLAKKPVVQKKLAEAPKAPAPSPRKAPQSEAKAAEKAAREKFYRTGRPEDAVSLILRGK